MKDKSTSANNSKTRPAKTTADKTYSVPALDKGLDILECLAARGVALTSAQIARELQRGQSELFRMLVGLERRGYIARESESGAYLLTLRLWEMAHTHTPFQALLRAARQPMRELAATTGESCHLSTVDGGQVLVLAQEESAAKVRLSVEVGSVSPWAATVSGRVLLAFLPSEQRATILEQEQWTRAHRHEWQEKLAEIAARGYEEAHSESIQGVWDVAAPVGSFAAGLPAALAIAAPTRHQRRTDADALRAALQKAVRAINAAAGLKISGEDI